MTTSDGIIEILGKAKKLAQQYRDLTGKPLGITGEVAEYEAARLLGVSLTPARNAGYDATETRGSKHCRHQIKGLCLLPGSKLSGQRIGSIDVRKEFDAVLLVLLDRNFDAMKIYEAPRDKVVAALTAPGSVARNQRGSLVVPKFISIGSLRWQRESGISSCRCCEKGIPVDGARTCPECGHEFQGNGWDGIDAHWRSRHERLMPYEDFWASLCSEHRAIAK